MSFRLPNLLPSAKSGEAKRKRARARFRAICAFPGGYQAGNAVLQVVFILSILTIGVYIISDRIQTHRNVVLQSGSVIQARFALHSMVDYIYYAVQRRYCLNDNLLNEPGCELKYGVNAKYGRSLERVLMSSEQAENVKLMVNGAPACPTCVPAHPAIPGIDLGLESPLTSHVNNIADILTVDRLLVRMKVKDMAASHPLYPVVDPLKKAMMREMKNDEEFRKLDLTIRVYIERDWSSSVNRTGNEVYFQIVVALEDKNQKVLSVNNTPLEVMSYGTLFQRELGSFALMVPRDLRLDGPPGVETCGTCKGDVQIPYFNQDFLADGGKGITFMSPIFVNRDINLPKIEKISGGQKARNLAYAPVTFAGRVVMGNGMVKEKEEPYIPDEPGSRNSLLWGDNKLFGGFKAGILVDGFFDRGLAVFSGNESSVPSDGTLMQQCNAYNNMLSDMNAIKNNEFYANLEPGSTPGDWTYRIGFSGGNSFYPQAAPHGAIQASATEWGENPASHAPPDYPPPSVVRTTSLGEQNAVIEVQVTIGDKTANVIRMNKNSDVKLVAQVASEAWITELQSRRDAVYADPMATADQKAEADARIAELDTLLKNPGEITLKVRPESYGVGEQKHQMKLEIQIKNDGSFRSGTVTSGPFPELLTPQIRILGYDPIHVDHAPVNETMVSPVDYVQGKKTRYLVFTRDGSGPLEAPANFSLTATGAPIDPAPENDMTDWLDLEQKCKDARNQATGQSFGSAAWNVDFATSSTFRTWNFSWGLNQDPPIPGVEVQNADNALVDFKIFGGNSTVGRLELNPNDPLDWNTTDNTIGREEFDVASIVGDCRIKPAAQLVTGFYTCHNLIIEERDTPLYIVGTFVVRRIDFEGDAQKTLKAGINWMSIYHPDATQILRKALVLRPKSNNAVQTRTVCSDTLPATSAPVWAQEHRTGSQLQDFRACNVVSLRAKSNNHTWTSFDPDCGLPPGMAATSPVQQCKNRPVNFFVMEHARGGGP